MACFLVPVAEAIVVTAVKRSIEKKERKAEGTKEASRAGFSSSRKLGWLSRLLWGGSLLLTIEHIWHGEVVPWPPFLTAMYNPADVGPMLHELATVGTAMAACITLVWLVMVLIADRKARAFSAKAEPEVKT